MSSCPRSTGGFSPTRSRSRSEARELKSGFAPTLLKPIADRVDATADLAAAWTRLRSTSPGQRKVALVLANYPNRDGRLANGVGLDTPQSVVGALKSMQAAGYDVGDVPLDAAAMMDLLQSGPTNALDGRATRAGGMSWPTRDYQEAFEESAGRRPRSDSRPMGRSRR